MDFTPRRGPLSGKHLVNFVLKAGTAEPPQANSLPVLCAFGGSIVSSHSPVPSSGQCTFACPSPAQEKPGTIPVRLSLDAGSSWHLVGQFQYLKAHLVSLLPSELIGQPYRASTAAASRYIADTPLIYGSYGEQPREQSYSLTYWQGSSSCQDPHSCPEGTLPASDSVTAADDTFPAGPASLIQIWIVSIQYSRAQHGPQLLVSARTDGPAPLLSARLQAACLVGSTTLPAILTASANSSSAQLECTLGAVPSSSISELVLRLSLQDQLAWSLAVPLLPINATWPLSSVDNALASGRKCSLPALPSHHKHAASGHSSVRDSTRAAVVGLRTLCEVDKPASFGIVFLDATCDSRCIPRNGPGGKGFFACVLTANLQAWSVPR